MIFFFLSSKNYKLEVFCSRFRCWSHGRDHHLSRASIPPRRTLSSLAQSLRQSRGVRSPSRRLLRRGTCWSPAVLCYRPGAIRFSSPGLLQEASDDNGGKRRKESLRPDAIRSPIVSVPLANP